MYEIIIMIESKNKPLLIGLHESNAWLHLQDYNLNSLYDSSNTSIPLF